MTRQKKEYPFIEIFHSPAQVSLVDYFYYGNMNNCENFKNFVLAVQATVQGKVVDPNITKYSVKVLPVRNVSIFYLFQISIYVNIPPFSLSFR